MADKLTRAITKDGFFKISAVVSTETVEQSRKFHNSSPVATAALGRLLTAGLLMGGELKEDNAKLTLQMSGDGPLGRVIVSANSKGEVKGYAENPQIDMPLNEKGKLDVGGAIGKGTLSIIKDLGLKEPYIGQVAIQTGEVGDDLAYYFMQSEQVPSVVALGVLVDRDFSVKCAGGFIIQVMPECNDESLTMLENSIAGIMSVTEMLSQGMDGVDMIKYAMLGFDTEVLEESEVGYVCDCSRERMERAIVSLGKAEIDAIIKEQGQAEIVCSFCNKPYVFNTEELEAMRDRARDAK
ncbi:MAG: Hsp33 family molecular chaperone HslO [Clostridiales bacterium]|nr:Hsp33 family molecular chaperone HslO [Clostridiales bacterium]